MENAHEPIAAAYAALAEACRAFGHTVEVSCPEPNRYPTGLKIDGAVFAVDISAECSCDRWEYYETGRLRITYKRGGKTRSRPEAKAGFPFDVLAAEICEAAAQKAMHDKAEADRRVCYAAAQTLADAINEECGVQEITDEFYRSAKVRRWKGPQASPTYEGEIAVCLRASEHPFFKCTPEEARELLTVALRIHAAHPENRLTP